MFLSEDDTFEGAIRSRAPEPTEAGDSDARRRLALTRVLIWAEREASAMSRSDVSDELKKAIAMLHRRD